MSKLIAPVLATRFQLPEVFAGAGLIVGLVGLIAASCLRNPPGTPTGSADLTGIATIGSRQFVLMWLVFFCNIAAGIAIISFQSPLLQDLWHGSNPVAAGATLIAVSSVFNGLGRLFWGALSDRLGQLTTFRVMLATQVIAFGVLMKVSSPWLFGALICYVLLCYGGGFGVMPSFVLNTFGSQLMPVLYGCILTAWSAAGIVGPQVIAALKDRAGAQAAGYAFGLGAGLLALGFLLAVLLRRRSRTCFPAEG
jgi:OFA family oxalate/formate antiporter-like MFS transporter